MKFSDGHHNKFDQPAYFAFMLGLPDSWSFSEKYAAWDVYLRNNPMPVGPIYDHPWVGFGIAKNSLKKYYRVWGNRYARRETRRRVKYVARLKDIESWEGHFLHKHESFNAWDLW